MSDGAEAKGNAIELAALIGNAVIAVGFKC